MKRWLLLFGILLVCGAAVVGWLVLPLAQPEADFTLQSQQTTTAVSEALQTGGYIRSAIVFRLYLHFRQWDGTLQAGQHDLQGQLSFYDVAARLHSGSTLINERSVTLIEGWTKEQIANALATARIIDQPQFFLQALADRQPEVEAVLGDFPPGAEFDGVFFPDTYRFFISSDPDLVLDKIHANFTRKALPQLRAASASSGLTLWQTLTLASIIEKELQTADDRQLGADVFLKRLAAGMPLQSDATVNYVTKKSSLRPSLDDTNTVSPYNTYRNAGLPPGPIANPGLSSITAISQRQANNFYYFISTPEGQVIFAKTFSEHQQNINRYLE